MKAMRTFKVVHRDIKNANILLHFPRMVGMGSIDHSHGMRIAVESSNEDLDLSRPGAVTCKLADFGFSMVINDGDEVD